MLAQIRPHPLLIRARWKSRKVRRWLFVELLYMMSELVPASKPDNATWGEGMPASGLGSSPTRASLLIQLRDDKNAEAWQTFVDIYTPLIYGHALRRGLQPADAADVAQNVMRSVVQALRTFHYDRARGSFRAWLLTVTRSKLNNFFAKRGRQAVPLGHTELASVVDREAGSSQESETWDREYQLRLLEWACEQVKGQFSETTWSAFQLSALEQIPVEEVAARLGMSTGAVYVARCRVAAQLRKRIQAADEEDIL
jgi:RNA polymerase sigma factor (sigma-70 family)